MMRLRIVILIVFCAMANCPSFGQTAQNLDAGANFGKEADYLAALSEEFTDYLKSIPPSSSEWDTANDLGHVSDSTYLYATAMQFTMTLFDLMHNSAEKQRARNLISIQAQYYVGRIEIDEKLINGLLINSKSPAIVAAGNRLKTELRKTKGLLQTVSIAK